MLKKDFLLFCYFGYHDFAIDQRLFDINLYLSLSDQPLINKAIQLFPKKNFFFGITDLTIMYLAADSAYFVELI